MKKYLSGSRDAHAAYEAGRKVGIEKGEAAGYEKGMGRWGITYAAITLIALIALFAAIVYGNGINARQAKKIRELQERLEQVYTGGLISENR